MQEMEKRCTQMKTEMQKETEKIKKVKKYSNFKNDNICPEKK